MKRFNWNTGKNERLRADRGISFVEILFHIENGDLLDKLEHPNQGKCEGQRVLVVAVEGYAYLVPFVEDDGGRRRLGNFPEDHHPRSEGDEAVPGQVNMAQLERDEKALRDSVEAGEWRSIRGRAGKAGRYRAPARDTLRKDRRVNIRLAARDLEAIQQRALLEGVSYETLIASVLHKYAAGRLVDKDVQS